MFNLHKVKLNRLLKQLQTKNLRVKKLMNCFGNSATAYFGVLDSFVRWWINSAWSHWPYHVSNWILDFR